MSDTKKKKENSTGSKSGARNLSWEARVKRAREEREKILRPPEPKKAKESKPKKPEVDTPAKTVEAKPLVPPAFKPLSSADIDQSDSYSDALPSRPRKSKVSTVLALISAAAFGVFLYLDGSGYIDNLRSGGEVIPEATSGMNQASLPDYGSAPVLMTEFPPEVQQWGQNLEFPSGEYATPVSFSFRAPSLQPSFIPLAPLNKPSVGSESPFLNLGEGATSSATQSQKPRQDQSRANEIDSTPPNVHQPTTTRQTFFSQRKLSPEVGGAGLITEPEAQSRAPPWPPVLGQNNPLEAANLLGFDSVVLPDFDPQTPNPSSSVPDVEISAQSPDPPLPTISADVSLFVPTRLSDDEAGEAFQTLTQENSSRVTTARVNYSVRQTQVRYYHSSDADSAAKVAEVIGGISRDFTGSASKTRPGHIEVYLAGTGSGQPRRAAPNSFEAFLERLLQDLR